MSDLEILLVADEDARARLDAVRADHAARCEAARAEYGARRQRDAEALRSSFDQELTAIAAEADAEVAGREAVRRERMAAVEARATALVEPAAALWVRIVEEGLVP
jgi:hypothetical protein